MAHYQTWHRESYKVVERDYNHDLHIFEVIYLPDTNLADTVATIYPHDLDVQESIISDLNNGVSVEGWETGDGDQVPGDLRVPPGTVIEFDTISTYQDMVDAIENDPLDAITKANFHGVYYPADRVVKVEVELNEKMDYVAEHTLTDKRAISIARRLETGHDDDVDDVTDDEFAELMAHLKSGSTVLHDHIEFKAVTK